MAGEGLKRQKASDETRSVSKLASIGFTRAGDEEGLFRVGLRYRAHGVNVLHTIPAILLRCI